MRRIITFITLFAFIACADPEVLSIEVQLEEHAAHSTNAPLLGTIERGISPTCVRSIIEADAFWSERLGLDALLRLRVVDRAEDLPPHLNPEREVVFRPVHDVVWLGATYRSPHEGPFNVGRIELRDGDCDFTTAAHELGHILGLEHTDDPGDLMFGKNRGGDDVSDEEVRRARESLEEG